MHDKQLKAVRPSESNGQGQTTQRATSPVQLKADFYAGNDRQQAEQIQEYREISATLHQAANLNELGLVWLQLLAKEVDAFAQGLILLKADENLVPMTIWPTGKLNISALNSLAQSSLKQQKNLQMMTPDQISRVPYTHLTLLIELEKTLYGVVAITLASDQPAVVKRAILMMNWGSAWLTQLIWRDGYRQTAAGLERSALIADLLLLIAEKPEFHETLLTLVNELATRLQLKRVSLGWVENTKLQVRAISHAAHFQKSHEAIQRLLQAMEEAYDQGRHIVLPYPEGKHDPAQNRLITSDHQQLLLADSVAAVASFLIQSPGRVIGVLTFEYSPDRKPSQDDVLLGDLLGSALAPLLTEKSRADRWLGGKFDAKVKKLKSMLLGDEHPVYKLAAASLLLVLALLFLVQADFRITAKTVIEGLVQRAAIAPFDGFIAQAPVRAGDHVIAGQLVAGLDNRDLLLEKTRLDSEVAQNVRKYRDALVKHDRAAASVSAAQLDQAEAELALVTEKLHRAAIKAPFDGIVVSGDLSQKLGAPVEQGNVLFEITPLDAYRIILKVDERDIGYVQPGQSGQMTLTGLTKDKLAFNVKKVTPVAVAEEGMNYFRVEAELVGDQPILRPGMEGVGKILVGEDNLWRIWTRRFFDWLSISLWTWMP